MKKFNEWLVFKESVPQPAQPDYANSALLKDREEHAKRAEESKKFIDSVRKTFKRPLEDFEIGEHVDVRLKLVNGKSIQTGCIIHTVNITNIFNILHSLIDACRKLTIQFYSCKDPCRRSCICPFGNFRRQFWLIS